MEENMKETLKNLGIQEINYGLCSGSENNWIPTEGPIITSYSPINGEPLASVRSATKNDIQQLITVSKKASIAWRNIPAPKRGEIIRQIGNELRLYKDSLGKLVTLETGKILQEGLGEVQEMIDIADFSVGQSRMLYGSTMQSERPSHRIFDQYHPYGVIGVISAFNFPVAVWSWNALLAAVCGNVTIWKPSTKAPLCGIAVQNIVNKVCKRHNIEGLFNLIIGQGSSIGESIISSPDIPLISATGSTRMGKHVSEVVGKRLGHTILELGGNNAIIVTEKANMKLAVSAALFGAVGTTGQRCTSTRRIIVHSSKKEEFINSLTNAYRQLHIGNPLEPSTHVGPLIDIDAWNAMEKAVKRVPQEGGKILYGGERIKLDSALQGVYVKPCIAEVPDNIPVVKEETFAPLLYIMPYNTLEEAIEKHNNVPQGLSSAIFTNDLLEAESFLSNNGSDCGIANVNIGTSGAEIGGAFGGEKETGGGRESGSDAWKGYMRRQTVTINYGSSLPLAQGIEFPEMD